MIAAPGQCDTCRVTVVSGSVDAAGTRDGNTVLACQAKVTGPVEFAFEAVPVVRKARRPGRLDQAGLARDLGSRRQHPEVAALPARPVCEAGVRQAARAGL